MSSTTTSTAAADAQPSENLVIFYDDLLRSDTIPAALAVVREAQAKPNTRIVWIVEPRHVAVGFHMTDEEIAACKALLAEHFPLHGDPAKVLLGGLLLQDELDLVHEKFSEEEYQLLKKATKAAHDPEDPFAPLQAELMALDFAHTVHSFSTPRAPVHVFIGLRYLDRLTNPVNLHIQHHEELINRSPEELRKYQGIIDSVAPSVHDRFAGWFDECIDRLEGSQAEGEVQIEELGPGEFMLLCSDISRAETVQFLGGASLTLLESFLVRGLAPKIDCHLQFGSCDLSGNAFSNQFNIALNVNAARRVLKHRRDFKSFTVVPSHTAQKVSYSLKGLVEVGGKALEPWLLGFNCKEAPMAVAAGTVSIEKDYPDKMASQIDLTAFLCHFRPEFLGAKLSAVEVEDRDGVILFKRVQEGASGIAMYEIESKVELTEQRLRELWPKV